MLVVSVEGMHQVEATWCDVRVSVGALSVFGCLGFFFSFRVVGGRV